MRNCVVVARREANVTAVCFCAGGGTDISLLDKSLVFLSICLNEKAEVPFYTI